ncbi:murein L,D-transpeptidase family protein [Halobacteriovorax sp. HLS]|uniref:L,D-transpeptidase family protein n=1 Tax=Halobacteriovorax sp. HLS TaxID=2234000 RepID=UPI000FD731C9|nr:L,D-transpeptidase family protein [Halobacteriovorax sp. HLS]
MYKTSPLILITLLLSLSSFAEQYLPTSLLMLEKNFSHHVIVAEKSTHSLYLYSNENGLPALVKEYPMATGKKAGDKIFQGDHRTPEGIYFFTDFLTHQDLLDRHGKQGQIYGVGAFVMNYPNPIDQRAGKTGGGIWLHSTNDETRIDKGLDSRGCVVATNSNLIEISKFLELNRTPIIVVHNMQYLTKTAWLKERSKLNDTLEQWLTGWQNENTELYFNSYHKEQFFDKFRGNYEQFKQYKRAVFNNAGTPKVEIEDVSIFRVKDYAVISFQQIYTSNTINDIGRKTLYLKQDKYYEWKIVNETWTKSGIKNEEEAKVAFQPSMRFFKDNDPKSILGADFVKRVENN